MRRVTVMLGAGAAFMLGLSLVAAHAEDRRETGDKVLSGVIGGLLGTPAQPADATYLAGERERLVTALQSGEYATSRQGEPVDLMILGVPLTRANRVYTASPIPPSRTSR